MPTIVLETFIDAPIERVFDLSKSIDLHKHTMTDSQEEAISGRTSGLIELNETVTWRAKHFGIYQLLTVKIIDYDRPTMFCDKMLKGTFASMKHIHQFENQGKGTKMTDIFHFTSPLGLIGVFANWLFLNRYMTKLLKKRNIELKVIAESGMSLTTI
jgi:ligand-binding SRPBCC domain-containing protein